MKNNIFIVENMLKYVFEGLFKTTMRQKIAVYLHLYLEQNRFAVITYYTSTILVSQRTLIN